jgi:site-specific DNA recombinase|tara:strand:- start:1832 stop:3370 length:1539 start_codon:yes stop_codon:yes gene_type:complete
MKECFGYIRVSTMKQGDGVSLEAQKEAILNFASRHGISITRWFEEKETAAKKGRPVFNRMVSELRRRRADGLVIHKIDRSARNLGDWARIGELADAGIDIHFATESLDFRSRGGRLAADVQAVVAADYVRNLREECLKGMNGRLKQGLFPWGAPIGYLNNGGGKPKTPDPKRAPLIRLAFELYASGRYSQRALLKELDKRGLRKPNGSHLRPQNIETILANPFYCGLIRIKKTGMVYPGCHKPLVPVSLFERAQDVKAGKSIKKITVHDHTYRRLFRCGHCDGPMVPERQKGRVYYRCQLKACPTKTVREDAIDQAIEACLWGSRLTDDQADHLERKFHDWLAQEQAAGPGPEFPLKLAEIRQKLDRLTDALVDRLIDQDTFKERKQSLALEEAKLKEQMQEYEKTTEHPESFREFLELVKSLVYSYQIAAPPEKQSIAKMATSNRTIKDKNVYIEPSKWLLDLQLAADVRCGGLHRGADRTFEIIRQCHKQYQGLTTALNYDKREEGRTLD